MTNNDIPLNEIEWIPSSTADPVGRVFVWNKKVYRAIRSEYDGFYKRLISEKILDNISSKIGLIPTMITGLKVPGYSLILNHELISFQNFPYEWCSEMFRDAAKLVCELSLELLRYNLELKDIHPYNIMYQGYLPKFVDVGSIIPVINKSKWSIQSVFRENMIYPLLAMESGQNDQVRLLFKEELDDIKLRNALFKTLSQKRRISELFGKFTDALIETESAANKYRTEISKIKLKDSRTQWSKYAANDDDYNLPLNSQNRWFDKQKNVNKLLKRLKPYTVLDLGANIGWYSKLAVNNGANLVIATDIDEPSLNTLYLESKKHSLPIQTAYIDFVKSTAANITWSGASSRYRTDLVLCLALTHHLVFKNYLHFDSIAGELGKYARKWAIVEFVPADDEYIRTWIKPQHMWYTKENFIASLEKHFRKIEIFNSTPSPRMLFLCTK